MKIKSISIKDFQGFNETRFGELKIKFNGKNANIYGANGTGKSTIKSAVQWMFTDRNSLGHTVGNGFDIMPKDPKTEEIIHYLEPTVEMVLALDSGLDIELKKTLVEKWKKADDNGKTFDGYTTEYYLDDAGVNKGVYNKKVAEILKVDQETYKILTDPLYVNETLHWTKRRKLLLERVGGEADKEAVFEVAPKLRVLEEHLRIKDIDEHKTSLKAQIKKLQEKLEEIPIQIKENIRNKPDISKIDFKGIGAVISDLNKETDKVRQSISDAKNGAGIGKQTLELAKTETLIVKLKHKYTEDNEQLVKLSKHYYNEATSNVETADRDLRKLTSSRVFRVSDLKDIESKIQIKREEWEELNKLKFVAPETPDICFNCGQKMPDVDNSKAEETFNMDKSKNLELITKNAKDVLVPLKEKYEQEIKKIEKEVIPKEETIKELKVILEEKKKAYDTAKEKQLDVTKTEEYQELIAQKESITTNIANLKTNVEDIILKYNESLADITTEISSQQTELAKKGQHDGLVARNEELGLEEKALSKKIQGLQKDLSIADEYTKTMVGLMDVNIAKYFELARFKMYNMLTNGTMEDCCDCIKEGVTYWSVNYGSRMCMGIDIINSFSKFYDFHAPVWLDESGELTDYLVECESQLIRFYARAEDKELRIEV